MRRLLCFGDSNTFGYDPRSFLGGRYPDTIRWTEQLGENYEVFNGGENGRMTPRLEEEYAQVRAMIRRYAPLDGFLVMLGSNDLLCSVSAEQAAARMGRFLAAVQLELAEVRTLWIAPPPMRPGIWTGDSEIVEQSERFGACCCDTAKRMGIPFTDAAIWGVGLTFDGVHFSERGHAAFAAGVRETLGQLFVRGTAE